MLRRGLAFLVVAGLTLFLEMFAVVLLAGEVSCYEVCSPVWEFVERYEPLPSIVGLLVAIGVGWAASLLVKPLGPDGHR